MRSPQSQSPLGAMAATLILTVVGVGGTEEAGWPWLRARAIGRKERLLLDRCLLHDSGNGQLRWKKDIRLKLQVQHCDTVVFELWTAASRSTDLLQFVATWSVDLVSSIESGTTERWYPIALRRKRHTRDLESREIEYCESSADLSSTAAYVRVSIATIENPPLGRPDPPPPDTMHSTKKPDFHFVLPRRNLARSSKLRFVRVGQIVHELRTDTLRDLLPLTLYGSNNTERSRRASSKLTEPGEDVRKALILLQFSCQYANHCVNELDRYSSMLEKRSDKYKTTLKRLKQHQQFVMEQRRNLERELDVASCSLGGMQSLLQQLDPGAHAQLEM